MGTSTGARRASAQTKALAALTLVVAICLLVPASAFAVASYVFEPTLSLTGNCATSKLDPVPDPGTCPIPPGTLFSGSPGADHPSKVFKSPGVTVDDYGDIYVVSTTEEEEGRIDVFSPKGLFITEIKDEAAPQSIAVDSEGNLYVFECILAGEKQVRRFPPTVYKPEAEEIEYGAPVKIIGNKTPPFALGEGKVSTNTSVAIDPANDQLFVDYSRGVARFGSAKEGNVLLDKETVKVEEEREGLPVPRELPRSTSIAIDAKHGRIYVSDRIPVTVKSLIRIFELKAPYKELGQITGSTTPKGEFVSGEGFLRVDVDEGLGHVFVGDFNAEKVYEFDESGGYLATIEHGFEGIALGEIAVDNGSKSPHPQKEGWLFVPSVQSPAAGHVYAFEPHEEGPPIIDSSSVSGVTEAEAVLRARINPDGLPTEYRLEYITQQQWEEEGKSFANATIAGEGTLPKGAEGKNVSAPALGLEPETAYRFRAFAENEEGTDAEEKTFITFPSVEPPPGCPNVALRKDLSALLPDCRAYELVTPPNTNGRPPTGGITGIYFPAADSSPDGNRASFLIEGGSLPGEEGSGSFKGDRFLATRGSEGWSSTLSGPNGEEAFAPTPGSASSDQTYSIWGAGGEANVFLHYPDGHSELVGRGSLGEDPRVNPDLVTEGAGHIIFTTEGGAAVPLEPNSPPAKTGAVYDRSAAGPTHVVSLLPGEEIPKAGENAKFLGSSEDGEGIAFQVGNAIYIRLHNTETLKVAGPGTEFAGISEEGKRVFYLEDGDLFAYDTEAEEAIPFSSTGDVTVVNVATGGTRAYFVSPSKLTGEPNPSAEEAEAGKENLYLSAEGTIGFVGTVTKRDVEGGEGFGLFGGLGLWIAGIKQQAPAKDPSRTTPSGSTLLFESRADLAGFESEGFAQVYRYDSDEGRLDCLSCSPTGAPPSSNASLQSSDSSAVSIEEIGRSHLVIPNQTPDGKRAFFQTAEPLVLGDTDGKLDVYEWEEKGVGGVDGCKKPGGCVDLISGGHSAGPDFLFAMSRSGDDVFFRTSDLLLPRDAETTFSLYDARVEGGFPEPEPPIPCEPEGCHPVTPPPNLSGNTTSTVGPEDKVPSEKHCPKGKHRAKRHNKVVCVKNHHKKKHHGKAGARAKGGSR